MMEARLGDVRSSAGGRVASTGRSGRNGVAFGLYLALVVFTLLSIPSRFNGLGAARPTIVLIAVIALLIVLGRTQLNEAAVSRTSAKLNLLIAYVLVTLPFVQWPGSVLRFGLENLTKAVVFFYFTASLVDSVPRLRLLVAVVVGCQVIRVLEPLYLHVVTGYWGSQAHMMDGGSLARLSGAPSDIINPNGLAFVILTALPFLHYLMGCSDRTVFRGIYALLLAALMYAFILTGSRSGLVGLSVIVAVIVWRSPRRMVLGATVSIVGLLMFLGMSADMRERYLSLAESGTRHAETRDGRIAGWKADFSVAMQRPVFGHGLGTSAETMANFAGRPQIAHNLYTEVLLELGIVGFVLYLRVLASTLQNVARARARAREVCAQPCESSSDEVDLRYVMRLSEAIFAWVVMCLVFSMASYGLSEFYWYLVAGISVALVRVLSHTSQTSGSTGPPMVRRSPRLVRVPASPP